MNNQITTILNAVDYQVIIDCLDYSRCQHVDSEIEVTTQQVDQDKYIADLIFMMENAKLAGNNLIVDYNQEGKTEFRQHLEEDLQDEDDDLSYDECAQIMYDDNDELNRLADLIKTITSDRQDMINLMNKSASVAAHDAMTEAIKTLDAKFDEAKLQYDNLANKLLALQYEFEANKLSNLHNAIHDYIECIEGNDGVKVTIACNGIIWAIDSIETNVLCEIADIVKNYSKARYNTII